MRILIDVQDPQIALHLGSDLGQAFDLAHSIVTRLGEHQVILALNGRLPLTIEPIRAFFHAWLPDQDIRVCLLPEVSEDPAIDRERRRAIAERIHGAFLASLAPDLVHVCSILDLDTDEAIIGHQMLETGLPLSVSIDCMHPRTLSEGHQDKARQHLLDHPSRAAILNRASLVLTQSESMRRALIAQLGLPPSSVVNRSALLAESPDKPIGEIILHSLRQRSIRVSQAPPIIHAHSRRPRLAVVSPFPPDRTGIADYSAELLPELSRHYDIDVVVGGPDTLYGQGQGQTDYRIRNLDWLLEHASRLDRVIYHVGNAPFHAHMLQLIGEVPGILVLHDFFLGHLMHWAEASGALAHRWTTELYLSHGYSALRDRLRDRDLDRIKHEYPVNLTLVQQAIGVIVHSAYSRRLAEQWLGARIAHEWRIIPHLRAIPKETDRALARAQLGFEPHDFLICSFGFLNPNKLNLELAQAFLRSSSSQDPRCHLIFVGESPPGDYQKRLHDLISATSARNRVIFTGWVDRARYRQYLVSADLAVQLRTGSRGETSGTLLDCLSHGLATIVNANGSFAEFPSDTVWMLDDPFEQSALVEALDTLWSQPARRQELSTRALELIHSHHAPEECARGYVEAIEQLYARGKTRPPLLTRAIANLLPCQVDPVELIRLSRMLDIDLPSSEPHRHLYLDITATCANDLKTGIERVARELTLALFEAPPKGFRVEPVYLQRTATGWQYRHAHRYTLGLLGCASDVLDDEPLEPRPGDLLLGLDYSGDRMTQAAHCGLYTDYRNRGVRVFFMVHDLLPIRRPEVFPPNATQPFANWLEMVSTLDGAVCVSRTVAEDLGSWQREVGLDWSHRRPFSLAWSHHGADFRAIEPNDDAAQNASSLDQLIESRPTFLMVGTIEPRKAYRQVIDAFTHLWETGRDVNLFIVGKEGWCDLPDSSRRDIPATIDALLGHPQLNRRLFWLAGISDAHLETLYSRASCLIAASLGEGFGLPLIEAAQHGIALIVRDIPVFREVVGDHAFYFTASTAQDLSQAIEQWLALYRDNAHPRSAGMPWLTWRESASRLMLALDLDPAQESARRVG